MVQLLKSHLRKLIWFALGLICVLLFAIGLPLIQTYSMAISPNHQGSLHSYTPKNQPGTQYWSVGVTRDSNHLPDL